MSKNTLDSAISRRAILSAMAALPTLSGALLPVSASAQVAESDVKRS